MQFLYVPPVRVRLVARSHVGDDLLSIGAVDGRVRKPAAGAVAVGVEAVAAGADDSAALAGGG